MQDNKKETREHHSNGDETITLRPTRKYDLDTAPKLSFLPPSPPLLSPGSLVVVGARSAMYCVSCSLRVLTHTYLYRLLVIVSEILFATYLKGVNSNSKPMAPSHRCLGR